MVLPVTIYPATRRRRIAVLLVFALVAMMIGAGAKANAASPVTPGAFVSVDPARVLDTRVGNGAPQAAVAGNGTVDLQVTGRGGVPATGVAAVVVNVTVTGPSAGGFLTVYPSGSSQPTASNLNFTPGQSIPNLVTVKIGTGGKIKLTNTSTGTVHLIADVAGYYLAGAATAAGAFVSVDPARVLDTRTGNGAPQAAVAGNGTVDLQVTGRGGVPATGVAAVVVNVTVTGPSAGGFLTVYPSGTTQPTASNLNFTPGQSIPNLVTVKIGTGGKIKLTNNSTGSTHLIADVAGYYLAGIPTETGTFVSLAPARVLDTRTGNGAPQAAVAANGTVRLQVTGRGGVPATGVAAVVLNATVTGPASGGFITVYPSGSPRPTASNLNFATGQSIPNLVNVKIGGNGKINLANNSTASTHLIADVAGYYLGSASQRWIISSKGVGPITLGTSFAELEPILTEYQVCTRPGWGIASSGSSTKIEGIVVLGPPAADSPITEIGITLGSPASELQRLGATSRPWEKNTPSLIYSWAEDGVQFSALVDSGTVTSLGVGTVIYYLDYC